VCGVPRRSRADAGAILTLRATCALQRRGLHGGMQVASSLHMLRIALLGLVAAWVASLARLAFPRPVLVPVTVRRPVRRAV